MVSFTLDNTMSDIMTSDIFKDYSMYLMYNNPAKESIAPPGVDEAPLSAMSEAGWSPEGILNGLNFFAERIQSGHVSQHFVYDTYSEEESQKQYVNLIRITPDCIDESKPAFVLCAGGAYFGVCTMVESLPTARHFVEAGYQTFLFTYRVNENAVTPKAVDDLAAGIDFLCKNKATFSISPEKLVVGGYSAGANLISNWGATNVGYRKYNLPKPLALLPVYTFIDLKTESKRDENGGLLGPMFGENYLDFLEEYNIADHVDADYPPCYITCGKNDTTVPCENSELLKELLDKAGVPAILDEGENAQHGFGDGTGTDVEGWPTRALDFINSLL